MKPTYRAMQVSPPGILELVERKTPTPGFGEVLIEVEACGICGADSSDIEGADPALRPPRVPGHEVVGRIVALGECTPSIWKIGQRVGWAAWVDIATNAPSVVRGASSFARISPLLVPPATAAMPK